MNCYILFGCPGCGKSYYIKSKQLYSNTICYDKIRHKYNEITNNKIYEEFYKQIETYLKNNKNDLYIDMVLYNYNQFYKIKSLCDKYNYNIIFIDFTNIPLQKCINRNSKRNINNKVDNNAINYMYNSIIKLKNILKNNYKFIEVKENDNE